MKDTTKFKDFSKDNLMKREKGRKKVSTCPIDTNLHVGFSLIFLTCAPNAKPTTTMKKTRKKNAISKAEFDNAVKGIIIIGKTRK